ncbi:hypothetical protein AVEN_36977-1 [Araneus ventricosus]|uniref:Uncharacterized protein n=1 Tax=Araneus ventricosus TaxID=182803 RepID=A0A4Y2IF64_ARAVE|nr:hypothetical protein AVEN_36977-1 [Araneus ventricosus]
MTRLRTNMMMIGSSVDYVRSGGVRNVPVTKAVEHLYATTAKFSGCILLASRPAYSYPTWRTWFLGIWMAHGIIEAPHILAISLRMRNLKRTEYYARKAREFISEGKRESSSQKESERVHLRRKAREFISEGKRESSSQKKSERVHLRRSYIAILRRNEESSEVRVHLSEGKERVSCEEKRVAELISRRREKYSGVVRAHLRRKRRTELISEEKRVVRAHLRRKASNQSSSQSRNQTNSHSINAILRLSV